MGANECRLVGIVCRAHCYAGTRPTGDDRAAQLRASKPMLAEAGQGLIRYRFFGRSVLATVGAKFAGRPGGFGTCTFFGFLASLFPC